MSMEKLRRMAQQTDAVNNKIVSYEEQRERGLLRPATSYVPAEIVPQRPATSYVKAEIVPQRRSLPVQQGSMYAIDVAPTVQIDSRNVTSAVDRAKGFAIRMKPLSICFALVMVLTFNWKAELSLLSVGAAVILFGSYVAAWGFGWALDALFSTDGIAFYEARQKWKIIGREQEERWAHYNREG